MLKSVDAQLADVNDVVEGIKKDKDTLKEIYCVAFDMQDRPVYYFAGNWHNLAKASAFLDAQFINHCFEELR